MLKKWFLGLVFLFSSCAFSAPVKIVAAENFYGDIAQRIGGPYVAVQSIVENPNQDPHLFSLNPSHAKAIATANIVVYNGLNYDAWMENLLQVNQATQQAIINVGKLMHKHVGDNPHIWYDPETMRVYAETLTKILTNLDPAHQKYFATQLAQQESYARQLRAQIHTLKSHTENISVIATEPVFNYMAQALGFNLLGLDFQTSVMNETEPSVSQTKNFEQHLKNHTAKLFIYNNQVSSPLTEYMKKLAQKEHVPTVGVSETLPRGETYWQWMQNELLQIQNVDFFLPPAGRHSRAGGNPGG